MKKNLFLLAFVLGFSVLQAQISITSGDFPTAGDTLHYKVGTNNTFDANVTGTNYTWDFSQVQTNSERADTIISVFQTPAVYNVIFNPLVADLAYINQNPPTLGVGITVTGYYDFYKKASSYYRKAGFGAVINGVPTPVKYNNPELYFKLPLTYGTTDSSISSYGLSIPTYGYYGQTISRKHEADGWGTITTPFGTYNAIRVKETINTTDTIFSSSFNMGYNITRPTSYEYYWLTNGMKSYVAKAYSSGNLYTMEFLYTPALSVEELNNVSVRIFPNPASTYLTIQSNGNEQMNFSVLNSIGETVYSAKNVNSTFQIPVKQLPQGLYFLKMETDSKLTISKFIISR